jgi:hypothetical protein
MMQDFDDRQLSLLSARELVDLKNNIDTAIRAIIRGRSEAKANPVAAAAQPSAQKVDLEAERDAGIAARRK